MQDDDFDDGGLELPDDLAGEPGLGEDIDAVVDTDLDLGADEMDEPARPAGGRARATSAPRAAAPPKPAAKKAAPRAVKKKSGSRSAKKAKKTAVKKRGGSRKAAKGKAAKKGRKAVGKSRKGAKKRRR